MLVEGWVKCLIPQNTFVVSGVNSVAAKSNTIEVNGTPSSNVKKEEAEHASILLVWCHRSVNIHIQLKTPSFTPCFNHET